MDDEYFLLDDEVVEAMSETVKQVRRVFIFMAVSVVAIAAIRHYKRVARELGL
jgi:hypothetical protein